MMRAPIINLKTAGTWEPLAPNTKAQGMRQSGQAKALFSWRRCAQGPVRTGRDVSRHRTLKRLRGAYAAQSSVIVDLPGLCAALPRVSVALSGLSEACPMSAGLFPASMRPLARPVARRVGGFCPSVPMSTLTHIPMYFASRALVHLTLERLRDVYTVSIASSSISAALPNVNVDLPGLCAALSSVSGAFSGLRMACPMPAGLFPASMQPMARPVARRVGGLPFLSLCPHVHIDPRPYAPPSPASAED